MARQTQKVPSDEKRLREALRKYLLVEQCSPFGNELVDSLINVFKRRHRNPRVRLVGDHYFINLISRLLTAWDIQFTTAEEKRDENQDCEDIYVPGPQQRVVDIPAVVSYMIREFVEESKQRMDEQSFPNCPGGVCGTTILLLLDHTLWPDFDYMRQFLERAIVHDWNETGKFIEAHKAIGLSKDVFVGFVPTLDERFPTPDKLKEWFPPSPPKRDQMVSATMTHVWRQNVLVHVGHVRPYLLVDTNVPSHNAFIFRLCAIRQVMDNVYALSRWIPGRPEFYEGESELVRRILNVRRQLAIEKVEFTKEDEIQALNNAGICDPNEYDDVMAENHCGFFFVNPDTTYDEWKIARDFLFGYVKKNGRSRKPVVIAYPRYSQLKINGKPENYSGRVVRAVAFMIKSQKECLKSGKEPMFDRVKLCEELNIPEGSSRFTALRDILKGTPLEGKCRSLRRYKKQKTGLTNKYVLDVDIENSRVDE